MYYFKNKKRRGKKKYVTQHRFYLTKKEGLLPRKSFAKQTDAFTVLNLRT